MRATLTPELAIGIEQSIVAAISDALAVQDDRALIQHGFDPENFGDVVFGVERFELLKDELEPLFAMHWRETEEVRQALPLRIDWGAFIRDERAGSLMLFTVRQNGVLLGYCVVRITRSTHTGLLLCCEDALYLHPEGRRGLVCSKFADYAERCVVALGVSEIRLSVKMGNPVWKLWERKGYQRDAFALVKVIGERHV